MAYANKSNFGNWTVYTGDSITDEIFESMLDLNMEIFPVGSGNELEKDYIKGLFQENKEGVFIVMNERKEPISFFFNIVVPDEQVKPYLTHETDYRVLKNKGMTVGNNNLYLYSVGVSPKYRNSVAIQMMMKEFALWLRDCENKGKIVNLAFLEAVSKEGVKSATNGLGMLSLNNNSNQECGFYYSPDGLRSYVDAILGHDYSNTYSEEEYRKVS